jgi:hypothetical protein
MPPLLSLITEASLVGDDIPLHSVSNGVVGHIIGRLYISLPS